MIKHPRLVLADHIRNEPPAEVCIDGLRWVAARPYWRCPWWQRFALAWGVFTGKYDALRWIEQ